MSEDDDWKPAEATPLTIEVNHLHLSGLSWLEASTVACRKVGMTEYMIKFLAEAFERSYRREMANFTHYDGRPIDFDD